MHITGFKRRLKTSLFNSAFNCAINIDFMLLSQPSNQAPLTLSHRIMVLYRYYLSLLLLLWFTSTKPVGMNIVIIVYLLR